jgi:hypothetical protein
MIEQHWEDLRARKVKTGGYLRRFPWDIAESELAKPILNA